MNEQTLLLALQDEMVLRAERLVARFVGMEVPELGKTQSSKAMEVARSAESPRVFLNWLRYQAARERETLRRQRSVSFWTRGTGSHTLAASLASELSWLRNKVAADLPEHSDSEQERVTMRAATQLLGYFRRALIGAAFLQTIALEEGEP